MRSSISRALRHACIVLTVVFFSGHAMADDNDSGIYVGAGYGEFDTKIENVEGVTDVIGNIDTDDSAWKVFLGWRFNKFISLEADYIDLGNPRGLRRILPADVQVRALGHAWPGADARMGDGLGRFAREHRRHRRRQLAHLQIQLAHGQHELRRPAVPEPHRQRSLSH